MKTLEEIKQEYQNYEKESLKVRNPEDLAIYAEIIRDDILDDITIVQRDTAFRTHLYAIIAVSSLGALVWNKRKHRSGSHFGTPRGCC